MNKDLVKKILEASNQINKSAIRGNGNFVVVSSVCFRRTSKIKRILEMVKLIRES